MAQVFHKSMNSLARIVVFGMPLLFAGSVLGGTILYRSSYMTGEREVIDQPVPFSHKHHAGELGIDCRYCHTSVETSAVAGIPPTKTCMNCHQQMWAGAELLEPVRNSYKTNTPIAWNKVHNTPNYVYFNHSIHVAKGVGCVSCHDRIDDMPLVKQSKTLLMEWCLDCHRKPENHLRPKSEILHLGWQPADGAVDNDGEKFDKDKWTQSELGRHLKEKYHV